MNTWNGAAPPPRAARIGVAGWLRIVLKGSALGLVTYGCLVLLLVVRLIERPVFGLRRPMTPWITQFVCKLAFAILGIRHGIRGRPMDGRGAIVANHASWLDIFALNACDRIYFVAKSEVAGWPGIGWLARATGTVFIRRKGSDAKLQQQIFEARLRAGHRLLFFPEGTSSDGLRVLPFKSTLFAAFYAHGLDEIVSIQPVTVVWTAPEGEHSAAYGWWGDMDFGSHFLWVLSRPRQGSVEVVFHEPLAVSDFASRKELAAACEAAVRSGMPPASADPALVD